MRRLLPRMQLFLTSLVLIGVVNNLFGQTSEDSTYLKTLSASVVKYQATDADKALSFNNEKLLFLKDKKRWKEYVEASGTSVSICFNLNKLQLINGFLSTFLRNIEDYSKYLTANDVESFKLTEKKYSILLNQKTGKNKEAYRMIEEDINIRKLKKQFNRIDTNAFFFNYYSLSIIHFKLGEYHKAFDNCTKALDILLKIPKYNVASELLLNETLAQICVRMGDTDAGTKYWDKAAQALLNAEANEIKSSDLNFNASNFLLGKIERHLNKNELFLAEQTLEKAKQYIKPNTPHEINRLKLVGKTYRLSQDFHIADSVLQQALISGKTIFGEKNNFVTQLYTELSALYWQEQDTLKTLKELQNALISASNQFNDTNFKNNPSVSDALSKKELLELLNLKTDILLKLSANNTEKYLIPAFETAQLGIRLIDSIRVDYTADFDKVNLISTAYPLFEKFISTSYLLYEKTKDTNYVLTAYQAVEQSKALLLLEGLKSVEAETVLAEIDRNLLFQLRGELTVLEKKRNEGKNQDLSNANYTKIQNQIFDANRQFDNLIKTFETRYPAYFKLKFDRQLTNIKQTQDMLTANQTIVNYFVGDSSIFVFLIKSNTQELIEIKKDFPLDNWVKLLRGSLSAENYQNQADIYADMAFKLYEKLIKPIKTQLTDEITLIPDGILGYIPFEALLTHAPEKAVRFQTHAYLLREHSINYSFSATLLREMINKKHALKPNKNIITYAPFFNGNTRQLDSIYTNDLAMRRDFAPLSNSGEEAYSIAKLMGGEALIGKEATDSSFIKNAPTARMLLLATHGKANDKSSDYSYLVFASPNDSLKNTLFYVRDLYNLTLNADLVVLSACETGIGKLQRGEGIISLARAFAYAGAKSIVTSLWSVNDAKTKDLMLFFFKNLKKGKSKDAALREAKLALMRQKDHPNAHPFFWAGFIGIGDMSKIR